MPEPIVEPGRLIEVPTADAKGMERWCHGEFESARGELASYAFGWRTDEPGRGKWSIGIGVGNPGGATFHAEQFADGEDKTAFAFIDEAVADVPQGGPDLTADEARAHDTLPFIWFVVDCVVFQDPRADWMRHWILETTAITTPEVFAMKEPVLYVSNDDDDELWQCIGPTDAGEKGELVHLWHFVDEDATLVDVLDLQPGEWATREAIGGPWTRGSG